MAPENVKVNRDRALILLRKMVEETVKRAGKEAAAGRRPDGLFILEQEERIAVLEAYAKQLEKLSPMTVVAEAEGTA